MSDTAHGALVIERARRIMANGKARSWSHAIAIAADSLQPSEETPKANQERQFASQRAYLEKGKTPQ